MEWRSVNSNMDLCQERKLRRHVCLKNVDEKGQERSKRATLCICGHRESLWQSSERRAVVLYKKIRNGGKVCATCIGYVRGKQNSGELCSRNYRKFQGKVGLHRKVCFYLLWLWTG